MAIIINSLTPTNPTTINNSSITFIVDAYDDLGATLSYLWEFSSTGGTTYTSNGLTGNTTAVFTTSNLTVNQSGLYFRVAISNGVDTVYSNEYVGIGNRIITVTASPTLLNQVNSIVDDYPVSKTVDVGDTLSLTASSTLQNVDISTTTNVTNINFQWQYSTNDGSTWVNISNGQDIGTNSIVTITNIVDQISSNPLAYYKYSNISVSNVVFDMNFYLFRVVITYTGASNSPTTYTSVRLLVSPEITIYRQPGEGDDTQQVRSYKSAVGDTTGRVKVQVGALTTANTTLNYLWQMSIDGQAWEDCLDDNPFSNTELVDRGDFIFRPGTNASTDVLQLDRLIFFNTVRFRCIISGVSDEESVTSDVHTIYMTDVQSPLIVENSVVDTVEDRYGDITDRVTFRFDPIINATIGDTLVDINRDTGLNGDISLQYERKDPGSNTWYSVGTVTSRTTETVFFDYVASSSVNYFGASYTTPPLRRSIDNGARYRLRVEASSLYTLNGTTKTLIPYYSSEIVLNVYRTIYITNEPSNALSFANTSTSFSIGAIASSGSSDDIIYQWQYSTNGTTGWTNIPSNSTDYTGVNTDLLVVNSVSLSPTYRYFRCVLSLPDGLSSITSATGRLDVRRDLFLTITSLNDIYADQFDSVTFSVTASSLSAGQISYQWQKSINYNESSQSGTWTNISGQTTNTLVLLNVQPSDEAHYRLRLTSFGGEIVFSNPARLNVFVLRVDVTENIPTSLSLLEGVPNAYAFSCLGTATDGSVIDYQWQQQLSGSNTWTNITAGFNNSGGNTRFYSPLAFDRVIDNNSKIRCAMTSNTIPGTVYTNECTLTINRRFSYYADTAVKIVSVGSNITFDLLPSWTGGEPFYMWQSSTDGTTWTNLNETSSSLLISNVNNTLNNRRYRCRITLSDCNQHSYNRNNTTTIVAVSSVDFTVPIQLSVTSQQFKPIFYSKETQKTGAAIGTVICVAKPAGYVHDASSTTDDITLWNVSVSGSLTTSNTSSVVSSGTVYDANKPSWTNNSYTSPKWLNTSDRFPGYIEMRGQFLRARDFPELARIFGTTYGGTITGTYPIYGTSDIFRMPNLYGKRLMGTGNVNNNSGSTSIVPTFGPDGNSGGDKNVPGSMGGNYNYTRSAQLPPGSPGVAGEPDGTADGNTNASTFSLGTYRTTGFEEANAFVQPTFSGTAVYGLPSGQQSFTETPLHTHSAVAVGWEERRAVRVECAGNSEVLNAGGPFFGTRGDNGEIEPGPPIANTGESHDHTALTAGGTFDIVRDGGMFISDTTIRLGGQSRQIFDNNLSFFLRNNEPIPLNAPYYRLKYLIKAY